MIFCRIGMNPAASISPIFDSKTVFVGGLPKPLTGGTRVNDWSTLAAKA
jgi:hypothetical protein